jgi:hypothetical protein
MLNTLCTLEVKRTTSIWVIDVFWREPEAEHYIYVLQVKRLNNYNIGDGHMKTVTLVVTLVLVSLAGVFGYRHRRSIKSGAKQAATRIKGRATKSVSAARVWLDNEVSK